MPESVVSAEAIDATLQNFSALDESGDKGAMNRMAQRLGKEQPALLRFAAEVRAKHGDTYGEAAVFYATLVWAMFDRAYAKRLTRLTAENMLEADKLVSAEIAAVEGYADKPVHERIPPGIAERQPGIAAKLRELLEEDVRENALSAEGAAIILPSTLAAVEAFDASLKGTRPGLPLGPYVREEPKVGRNEPCSCGSGKKFKRCHGASAGGAGGPPAGPPG
jgi:SEC-C motif